MLSQISTLYLPGAVPIWCALFFAVAALWGYSQAMRSGSDTATLRFAQRAYSFYALSIVLSAVILGICLVRRDFRIEYVFQYSGLDLSERFQFAAFWAGQKGSFLIWLLWASLIGLLVRRSCGKDEASVMFVYTLTVFGLLFILVRENPFVMLDHAPVDGEGLNPLLQDDWMVIHPPVMFIGYAAGAIPFSFAVAAMLRGDTRRWAARAFPWALGGFMVLGTAILMGGYWAYRTLGWGGYWGWDPVENASLIPWLIGIVLIHGLYLERTRGRFRRANLVLACLLYMSVLYGTFLTRSGVLADFSVHSFVDLGLSRWLLAILFFYGLLSLVLLSFRLPKVDTKPNSDTFLSRGFFLVLSTSTVLISAIVITLGTSGPLITKILISAGLMDNQAQVGPEFYNRVNLPLTILVAFLMAAVPFLTWKGTPPRQLARKLVPASIAGVAITVLAVGLGVREPFHILLVLLAASALFANLHKTIDLVRGGSLGRAGGYLSHVGVGIMLIGVLASSAYDRSTKVTLEQGVPQLVDGLTLTFNRFVPRQGRQKESMEVQVATADGKTFLAYPKLFVNDRTRQLMPNPDIRRELLQDLYFSPIQYEPGQPPGIERRLVLSGGETAQVGDLEVRFLGLDMAEIRRQMPALSRGGPMTLTANLEIIRDGEATPIQAAYNFLGGGRVVTPPVDLPGGGLIAMTGIRPANGKVQLDLAGLGSSPAEPARLSLDLTRKPLIRLVWYGLYVILIGGGISTLNRFRNAKKADLLPAEEGA